MGDAFPIENRASFILGIKNPASPARGAGLQPKRQVPEAAQGAFRFTKATPDFLDQPGAEIVLAGAREDLDKALGVDRKPQDEDAVSAGTFNDPRLRKSRHPTKPGPWGLGVRGAHGARAVIPPACQDFI